MDILSSQGCEQFRLNLCDAVCVARVEVGEHGSASYSPRTYANAKGADLTVAFAVDFSTAGEKLTHKAAGDRYVGIDLSLEPIQAARRLYRALHAHDAYTLNVAGNGIYTLAQHGWSQERINRYVYEVMAKVHEHWPLKHVRSGGQTGVDMAGVTAAHALGIDALALLPKGFIQRSSDRVDRQMSEAEIRSQVLAGAAELVRYEVDQHARQTPSFMAGKDSAVGEADEGVFLEVPGAAG